MNPWRVPETHQPLGEINLVRRRVYEQSADVRRALNNQSPREPVDLDELFGRPTTSTG